jgi:hypothetical protein
LTAGVHALLPEPADVPALSAAICHCLGQPALAQKMGEAAKTFVQSRFDPAKMLQDTFTVYGGKIPS